MSDENTREDRHLMPEERIALQAEEIKQLQAENKQLKEQINTAKIGWDTYKTYSEQLEQQTVELLRKARKALHKGISELKVHCKYFDQTPEEDACIEMHEVVVEIDKVIGGKEDV